MTTTIDKAGNDYIVEGIFTDKSPRSRVILAKVKELQNIVATKINFTYPDFIDCAGVEKIEGEYCLLRNGESELTPLTGYVDEHPITPEKALNWIMKLARLWQLAEQEGVKWQLIPLRCLLVNNQGQIKVFNPLIADLIGQYHPNFKAVIDRNNYRAPEVIEGQPADTISRIYNLGVIFYYLITDTAPFAADKKTDTYDKIMTSSLIEPRYLNYDISRELNDAILKLLNPEREKRPGNWQEVKNILNELNGNCYADEMEEKENRQQSQKIIRYTYIKERVRFFWRHHWQKTALALLLIIALIIAGRTGQQPPLITAETTPREVVEYFYESINEHNVMKIQETADVDLGNLDRMLSESHVMQKMREAYGEPGEMDTDRIFGIEELQISIIEQSPPVYQVNYRFFYNSEDGQLTTEMEDVMTLNRIDEVWQITEIRGDIEDLITGNFSKF